MLNGKSNLAEDRPTLFPSTPLAGLEFDHIGLIVPDLVDGQVFLREALGLSCWTAPIRDPGIGVSVQFGSTPGSEIVYELISPLGDSSPVANALRRATSILNHVAYRTPHLSASADHLRALNCFPTGDPQPAVAYDGFLIQFWMSPLRFMIELIEKPGHRHRLGNSGEVRVSSLKESSISQLSMPSAGSMEG